MSTPSARTGETALALVATVHQRRGAATELLEGELVAGGLGSPASLAFGRGQGFDPCSIYVTQLFGDQILRVAVGAEGAPLYD